MTGLEAMTEIKPKFPPKVQQIWDDCGTHVTSMEAEQGAKEIEFFVESLIQSIQEEWLNTDSSDLFEILQKEGYL